MPLDPWRTWLTRVLRPRRKPRPRRAFLPRLETLEERRVPSVSGTGTTLTGLVEGADSGSRTVAVFTDTGPQPASAPLATINWGDRTGDVTVTASDAGAGHFTVAGSHTYGDEGNFPVTVTFQDNNGTATATGSAVVLDADTITPTATTIAATESVTFADITVATFQDSNPGTAAGDLSAAIDWGDNTSSAGTITGGNNAPFTVTGSHGYADEGTYPIVVRVFETAANATTFTATGSAVVADLDTLSITGTPFPATEGVAFTAAQVATFTDPTYPSNPTSDFSAEVFWGDGSSSAGTIHSLGGGRFQVLGSHQYADEGPYVGTIVFQEDAAGPAPITGTFTETVSDADALAGTLASLAPTEAAAFSGPVAVFTDADTNNVSSDFTAVIDWGDGTTTADTSAGTVGGGLLTVTGSHTYGEEGTYTVRVTLADRQDGGGTQATATATAQGGVVVGDAPLQATGINLSLTESTSFSGPVAHFTDADPNDSPGDYDATIVWGDGRSSAGTVGGTAAAGFTVSGQHTYGEDGSYPVTVFVRDHGGSVANTAVFAQADLVSDGAVPAAHPDNKLLNPWGIAASPTGPFWVADNGRGVATVYDGSGNSVAPVVAIPPQAGAPAGTLSHPTGIVYNGNAGEFLLAGAGTAAQFLIATEDGTIAGWNSGTSAATVVDNSAGGAVYKGLALAAAGGSDYLYATNFHAGSIDVFNAAFNPVALGAGDFGTFTDPALPAGFAPFGIAALGGDLYVTYARQQGPDNHDDQAGPGNGFIDVYDTHGNLLKRLVSGGPLNSPWGLALAPQRFGGLAGALLVGNFGDGTINAFDPAAGAFLGPLVDATGAPLVNSGTWGLVLGNGNAGGSGDRVYFTAGLNDEADGLLGSLAPTGGAVATVSEPPLAVTGSPLAGTEMMALSSATMFTVATFTHGDSQEPVTGLAASIDWGDGTQTAAVLGTTSQAGGPGTLYLVQGNHTYADEGVYNVTVTVSDGLRGPIPRGLLPIRLETQATFTTTATIHEEFVPGLDRTDANQLFISELYRDLLGRPVDPQGLKDATTALEKDGLTPLQVALNLVNSDEYRLVEVNQVYERYLMRPADPTNDPGIKAQMDFLRSGGTVEQLAAAVIGSPEYFNQARVGGNNDAFLDALYADAVHRGITPVERGNVDAAFASGTTRAQFALALLGSEEYRMDLVRGTYLAFLDRPADDGGLRSWTTGLDHGMTDELVIARIIGEPGGEYFRKTAL